MAATTNELEYARLRSYLNPYLKGPGVDAVLTALAAGPSSYLVNTVRAINDQLYIATAYGQYLDEKLAESGLTRPAAVGLSDDVFRQIGIEVKNRKQVRDLINNLLAAIFGDEFVRSSNPCRAFEPYTLADGDTLIVNLDEKTTVTIEFSASDFSSIASAKAQEVADAITKYLRAKGLTGTAIAKNDGNGAYVEILSDTIGASSSVTIQGGSAQNALQFDSPVAAGGNMSTQWTLSLQPGGFIRYSWSGGADPGLGRVSVGNYVNVFGGGFSASSNEGSYTISKVQGGLAGTAYFEVANPLGSAGIINQGSDNAVLFFSPIKKVIASNLAYAAVYQVQQRVLQIYVPSATQVVRRGREGSAHIHDPSDAVSLLANQEGPYSFDLSQSFTVSSIGTTLNSVVNSSTSKLISVIDSTGFPDSQGSLILGYGSAVQEGPIPYIARPSASTLLLSPAYAVKNKHLVGESVLFISQKSPIVPTRDGSDYAFYLTDVVSGRQYAEDLINSVAASGINIVFTVLYPSDIGLGKWGTKYTENPQVWGE